MFPGVATAVMLAALAVCLWAEHGQRPLAKGLSKPLASSGFVVVALALGAWTTPYGRAVLCALALSWVGDVALLGRSRVAFLVGLAAFLLGHLAYAIAFAVRGVDAVWALAAAPALFTAAFFVERWLGPRVPAGMRAPVVAYIIVITAMVTLAAGTREVLLIGAALAFWASDVSVALDRFAGAGFSNRLGGLPAYYLAQTAFAYSVV